MVIVDEGSTTKFKKVLDSGEDIRYNMITYLILRYSLTLYESVRVL
ncbi:hypothetical protein [Staphylococcus phage PT1-4]